MKIYFSQLAQKELQDAIHYYDEITPRLGDEILHELEEAKHLILSFPLAWAKIKNNQRKYILKRFPYILIYKVYVDRIVIATFAHQHRLPEQYMNRKEK